MTKKIVVCFCLLLVVEVVVVVIKGRHNVQTVKFERLGRIPVAVSSGNQMMSLPVTDCQQQDIMKQAELSELAQEGKLKWKEADLSEAVEKLLCMDAKSVTMLNCYRRLECWITIFPLLMWLHCAKCLPSPMSTFLQKCALSKSIQ